MEIYGEIDAMSLLDKAKSIPHGIAVITKWLGSGGEVVAPEAAQKRAGICLNCPLNIPGFQLTQGVAAAIKQVLAVKNRLQLRVQGEKRLGTCAACGCALKLQVHEPQSKVIAEMTVDERRNLPAHCWKLESP